MIRFTPIALAVLMLAPALAPPAAAMHEEDHLPRAPEDLLRLFDEWDARTVALLDEAGDVNASRDVTIRLEHAREAREDGRPRSALDYHRAARVALAHKALWAELESLDTVEQQRARLLAFGESEMAAAANDFAAFRAELHRLDGNVTSLRAVEAALFAAQIAMETAPSPERAEAYSREIVKAKETIPEPLALGLVDITYGSRVSIEFARDLLGVAEAREGVLPALNATAYAEFTDGLRATPPDDSPQPHMRPYIRMLESAAPRGEDFLAIASWFGAVRAEGIVAEQFKFQDAATRGVGAVADLSGNVNASLASPLLEAFTARGFDGLPAMEAADIAWAAKTGTRQDVATYVNAWIALVHADFMAKVYGRWSPIQPPPVTVDGEDTGRVPAPGVVLVLAVAGAAAVGFGLARRRR